MPGSCVKIGPRQALALADLTALVRAYRTLGRLHVEN